MNIYLSFIKLQDIKAGDLIVTGDPLKPILRFIVQKDAILTNGKGYVIGQSIDGTETQLNGRKETIFPVVRVSYPCCEWGIEYKKPTVGDVILAGNLCEASIAGMSVNDDQFIGVDTEIPTGAPQLKYLCLTPQDVYELDDTEEVFLEDVDRWDHSQGTKGYSEASGVWD